MKKIISVTLTSALCLGLCACQSDNKYDDLERRVSAIEEQLNTDSSEVVQTSNNNIESSEISESIESNHVYDLSGMSAEEMLNLFISFADVHTGDMITDYPSRFDVEPESASNNSFNFEYQNIANCINYVGVSAQIEMNDSITVEDHSCIRIGLSLDNYDLAAELYDLTYNYISNYDTINDEVDHREGTSWYSYFNNYELYMEKDSDNNYELTLQIPIITDETIEEPVETMIVETAETLEGEIMP